MVFPVIVFFAVLFCFRYSGEVLRQSIAVHPFWSPILFTLAAVTGIAGPVLVRTLFAHASHHKKQVDPEDFLAFQYRILRVSLITPYLTFIGILFELPRFYAGGMVLIALYALYYSFPSRTRIMFDRKIFRVRGDVP